ncbi:hypothetical protein [uncultured Roseibium sp.]|uniref:hypothetical protein n=1 Tax=uncultured Roseibium sp. TaxID=1936171 RepID=UPI003217D985
MTDLTHTVRNSLVDRERTFRLGTDALVIDGKAKQARVPYADIRKVQLIAYANTGGEQYQCTLSAGAHGRIKIRSHSYVSLGNFEDRSESYVPFLRDLMRRVAAASPEAEFVSGNTALLVVWLVVLLLFILGLGTVVLGLVDGLAGTWKFAMMVAVLLIIGPILWRRLRKGEVRRFDPDNPPLDATGDG